jgi:3-oxoacyl-[acyl-carrier-protein] synthase III
VAPRKPTRSKARATKSAPAKAVTREKKASGRTAPARRPRAVTAAKPGRARRGGADGPTRGAVIIRRVAQHLPETLVATAHLILAEAPDRIFSLRERRRMGIRYVRVAKPEETPSVMGAEAVRAVLAGEDPASIDLLVTATTTPADHEMWSLPAKIAQRVGATRASCFGFGDCGCAAPFAALRTLLPLLAAPDGPRRAVIVGAAVTPGKHFFVPDTIVGDGAGAILLERVDEVPPGALEVVRADYTTRCDLVDAFGCPAGVGLLRQKGRLDADDFTLMPKDREQFARLADTNGREIVRRLEESLALAGWSLDELRYVVPDNVSISVAQELSDHLALPPSRVFAENCLHVGHMWGVDFFVNLSSVVNDVGLEPGQKIASLGFGLGEHYGVLLARAT